MCLQIATRTEIESETPQDYYMMLLTFQGYYMTLWMHCFETNNKNPHLCFYLQFAVPLNNNNCCYLDHKPLLLALVRCLSRKPRELHCCSRDLSRNYCLHNYSTNSRHIQLIFVSWYLIPPVQVVEYKSIRMGLRQLLPSDPLLKKNKIKFL